MWLKVRDEQYKRARNTSSVPNVFLTFLSQRLFKKRGHIQGQEDTKEGEEKQKTPLHFISDYTLYNLVCDE